MKRALQFLFLFVIAVPAFAQEFTFSHLSGMLGGKYKVEMEFTRRSDTVSGSYRYIGKKDVLTISGKVKGQTMTLTEFSGGKTGEWQGTLGNDGSYSGTWTSADGKRKLPFSLYIDNKTGASFSSWMGRADTTYVYDYQGTSVTLGSCSVEISGIWIPGKSPLADSVNHVLVYFFEGKPLFSDNGNADALADSILLRESGDLGTPPDIDPETGEVITYSGNQYNYVSSTTVTWNLAGIFGTCTHAYGYSGGAHGWYSTGYNNFDVQTGRQITLDDIFLAGYAKPLQQIVDSTLRNDNEYGGCFWGEAIPLNNNFKLTNEGITFFYNTYEIAPYVCGAFETLIFWEDVYKWIDPKGPMGWVKN